MTIDNDPESKTPDKASDAKSLTAVLGQSEQAKLLVDECADELSSVNTALKEEVVALNKLSGVKDALGKNEAVQNKVQEISEKLQVVNQALEAKVDEQHVLEQRLATATQDEEAVRHAAFHDPLTGLPNRALFDNRLEHGLAHVKRNGLTLAVMFMDLDDFKKINDMHGHDIGDAVLKTVAERLVKNTRKDDTVSRHGGDEFLYLLMEFGDINDVIVIAEKIANEIQIPCQLSIGELIVKTSIGISIFPKDGITASDLVKKADSAMYDAKRNRSGYALAR